MMQDPRTLLRAALAGYRTVEQGEKYVAKYLIIDVDDFGYGLAARKYGRASLEF
jgi:hypothetical protein